jgi:hypothetical protein
VAMATAQAQTQPQLRPRLAAATAALSLGLLTSWAAAGRVELLAASVIVVAAGNGYAKAHSP